MAHEELPESQFAAVLPTQPAQPALLALRLGLEAPFTLGQYQILDKLGQGGMGMVFRAVHGRLKVPVAVKVLPPECLTDAHALKRFQREMEAIGRLNHHNIVAATDAGEAGGVPFLVMELVSGVDLARLVRLFGPLDVADACAIIRQAADGLQAAYEKNLVHRDVKPSNLLLSENGEVKVVDLGLARLTHSNSSRALTETQQTVGTADYMAPEQWEASHDVDVRADIYSLGCTFYTLLVGRPPFGAPNFDSAMKKMAAHARAPVKPVSSHGKSVPREIERLIQRMTAKKADKRPQTPAEVSRLLEPFTHGAELQTLARRALASSQHITGADVATPNRVSTLSDPAVGPVARRARPLWRRPLLGAGALAFLIMTAALFLANRREEADARPAAEPAAKIDNLDKSKLAMSSLDGLEPFVYHDLLRKPTAPVAWIGPNDPGKWRWDGELRRLDAIEAGQFLFPVGTTSRSRYTIEAGIVQNPWSGNVGIYWGYKEDSTKKLARAQGEPFASFQFIVISRLFFPDGHTEYWVQRGTAETWFTPLGNLDIRSTLKYSQEIPQPSQGSHVLALSIEGNRLAKVDFGRTNLHRLVSDIAAKDLAMESYTGELGLLTFSHHVSFANVRFMLNGRD